jgi:DNA (cytosine-5)-methyltransferase 1
MVGIREDVKSHLLVNSESDDAIERGFLPKPNGDKAPSPQELLGDLIDPNYLNGGATLTYPYPARNAIQKRLRAPKVPGSSPRKKGDEVSDHEYSKHSDRVQDKFWHMINSGGIPEAYRTKKFAQRVLPTTWGPEGPTITATSLPDDYVHFAQPRTLTVREWARLQLFPDWYEFKGKRHTGGIRRAGNPREGVFDREVPKYTQIGNAVPVGLGEAVGKHLAAILKA